MRSLVLFVALACAACGPSSAEIRSAKLATYRGTAAELYDIAEAVAAETYKIGETDRTGYRFATVPQWYTPEGMRQSAGIDDFVTLVDRSVQLTLIVEVIEGSSAHSIAVTPRTLQYIDGSPQPRELQPEDPNLPGWVKGRVDTLYFDIHKRAKPLVAE